MDKARDLSVEFLRSHAKGAVPVLMSISAGDAAAYLKEVPDNIVGNVLDVMQPIVAAAILAKLSPEKAAAVILAMDVHGRTQITRVLDDDVMKPIVARMPKRAARDLLRHLEYPEGTTGAAMSSDVPVFEKNTSVAACIEQLRAIPDKIRSMVFVTDDASRLFGVVDLARMLSAPNDVQLGAVADTKVRRLSPYSRLTSVVSLAAWDTALALPVVDSRGRLLGALHFDRLREGIASEQLVGNEQHLGQALVHVAEAFLVCVAGVLESHSAAPTISRPIGEGEN
ncbi:MAG: CBS domain-containing protein [Kiloniellales bacterium]|nr:CBS domain-containing protein [Kiloniellales bacterium]